MTRESRRDATERKVAKWECYMPASRRAYRPPSNSDSRNNGRWNSYHMITQHIRIPRQSCIRQILSYPFHSPIRLFARQYLLSLNPQGPTKTYRSRVSLALPFKEFCENRFELSVPKFPQLQMNKCKNINTKQNSRKKVLRYFTHESST